MNNRIQSTDGAGSPFDRTIFACPVYALAALLATSGGAAWVFVVRQERGLPRAADMEASGPAPLRGSPDERKRNTFGVAWSLPSGGMTGDLGRPRFRRTTD